MPAQVPTLDEFLELKTQVGLIGGSVIAQGDAILALETRVTALEEGTDPPDPPDPPEPTKGLLIRVTLGGETYAYDETEGADLGDYHAPSGAFSMSCRRIRRTDCPLEVDIRRLTAVGARRPKDAEADWVSAVFYYGNPLAPDRLDLPAYHVDINAALSVDVPAHWKFARWRAQSIAWPLRLLTIGELVGCNLLPRFDAATNCGTAKTHGQVVYTPMGLAGLCAQMGAGGARPDIGWVTDWQAEYICNPSSPTALANTLAHGEASGTIPWMVRDPATGALVDPTSDAWKHASFYADGRANPTLYQGSGSGIQIDVAHSPAVSYLPFLLTGDPYHLENLQAQVVMTALQNPQGWANMWIPPGNGQTRGIAWATRDYFQAAYVTPDDVPGWLLPKSTMRAMFDATVTGLNQMAAGNESLRTVLHALAGSRGDYDQQGSGGVSPRGCNFATWQEDYALGSAAWASMLFPELSDFVRWHAQNLILRVNPDGTSGWCSGWPELYWFAFQDSTAGPQYASYAEAWQRNSQLQGLPWQTLEDLFAKKEAFDYPNGAQAALSLAWQAGCEEAKPALDFLATALEAGLRSTPGASKEWKYSFAREAYRSASIVSASFAQSAARADPGNGRCGLATRAG